VRQRSTSRCARCFFALASAAEFTIGAESGNRRATAAKNNDITQSRYEETADWMSSTTSYRYSSMSDTTCT
jgi:hypothetical protein